MPSYEGIRLKIRNKFFIPLTCKARGRKLIDKSFTIISNNCWGGTVYEAHNLPKQSPTVGMFFMAEDYIKFLSDLKGYLAAELTFIKPEESRWKELFYSNYRFGSYPIGKLKDVEIFFLHYRSEQEVKEKWKRRCKRVNWNRLIVKFNDQNGCTEENVEEFSKLPFEHKMFFTCREWPKSVQWKESIERYCYIKQFPAHENIMASFEPFGKSKYINVTAQINSL